MPEGTRKGARESKLGQGLALHKRLSEHAKSIDAVENLRLKDFRCKFLAVDDIWIVLAETMLIERFKPVWNCLLDGFGNHSPGKGRKNMMMMSAWDCLHPGREWAKGLQPCAKTRDQLDIEVREYLSSVLG